MGQCTTGLRDSHGVLIRKPTDIMANHCLLFTPFERRRCAGHHQHASVCSISVHGCTVHSKVAVALCRCSSDRTRSLRPPSGGLGCPACADNVNVRSPSHDRSPRQCRRCDMEDYR
eukprot:9479870-Pyramimonas_sp.AAC.1